MFSIIAALLAHNIGRASDNSEDSFRSLAAVLSELEEVDRSRVWPERRALWKESSELSNAGDIRFFWCLATNVRGTEKIGDRRKTATRSDCGPAICEPCGRFDRSCFGENKIKNRNQASRQDRVENGDPISP